MIMVLIRCFGLAKAFSRRPMVPSLSVSPRTKHGSLSSSDAAAQGEALEHEQDRTACRGGERGPLCQPAMEPRGDPVDSSGTSSRAGHAEPEANLKGIRSMTLPQLWEMAQSHNIAVPEKATRGLLMRTRRFSHSGDTRGGSTGKSLRVTWTRALPRRE